MRDPFLMRLLDNFKRWSGACCAPFCARLDAPLCARLYAPLCVIFCGAVLATVLRDYPLGSAGLLAALLLYCAVLWHKPQAWLLLVPAALPVLDLAPWTGRFFLDEFDALLAATLLLLRAWRRAPVTPGAQRVPVAHRALMLFCLSAGIALLVGAWPLPALGLNGLNHYYSPYNGVRLAKGLVWALLLWPLLRAALSADEAGTQRRLALGMGLGVLAAALGVGWERFLFTGLFEFDSGYRAVGLFSAMHTGGAYIEAYFALALPFLAWWTWSSRRWRARLAGSAMLAIGSYALLVSYARAGYLAAAVALLVLLLAPRLQRRPRVLKPRTTRAAPWLLAGLTMLAALAWMVTQGGTMQRRYASSAQGLATRVVHWHDALRMMALTPAGILTGVGLGSYPRTFFLHSSEAVIPTYQALHAEHGDAYLAIAAGDPLYFEQSVRLHPQRRYQLSFRARSADVDAALAVPICEKWLLYSHKCIWHTFTVGDTHGQWQRFSASVDSAALGTPTRPFVRPLKLSMFNPAEGSRVDIDDVSLQDDAQHEQLRNGDFGKGTDFWFFSSDNHLPWHLENTWLLIAFEQGLFGLLTFAALVLCAIATLTRKLRAGDAFAAALAAALAAFLVLSLLDSVFDFPRISTMVYLILLLSLHVGNPVPLAATGEGSFN
ncbi:MAG: O-antigen ligase family protein [Massilia sp.]|nr:O-antigen ligase family protein [Massilia sp.]